MILPLAGALLGALAWRWRGSGHLGLGRLLCAGLLAIPALYHNWPLGLAVAALTFAAACLEHDPGGKDLEQNLLSGVLLTGFAALEAAGRGDWLAGGFLALAGLLKAPGYRWTPRGPEPDMKFLWRELAYGACWGTAAGYAI